MPDASRPRSESARGLLLILVSTAAYGTMPILAKLAMARGVATGALLAWRFALTTVLFALLSRGRAPALRQRFVLWAIGAVFIGNALFYFTALETVPASTVSLLLYTYPVIVTLLSAIFGLEALAVRGVVAAVLAFGGCALTAGGVVAAGPGVLFALASAFIYATYIVLCSRFIHGIPPDVASLHLAQVATVGIGAWAFAHGGLALPRDPVAWLVVAAIAVLCTVVAMYAFLAGLYRVGPGRAAVLSSLEVLVTLALAYAFLGERLGPRQAAGAVLILSAVVLQNLGRWRRVERRRPAEI
jgi:drug/metabolite transporter (DMT)-like permease